MRRRALCHSSELRADRLAEVVHLRLVQLRRLVTRTAAGNQPRAAVTSPARPRRSTVDVDRLAVGHLLVEGRQRRGEGLGRRRAEVLERCVREAEPVAFGEGALGGDVIWIGSLRRGLLGVGSERQDGGDALRAQGGKRFVGERRLLATSQDAGLDPDEVADARYGVAGPRVGA